MRKDYYAMILFHTGHEGSGGNPSPAKRVSSSQLLSLVLSVALIRSATKTIDFLDLSWLMMPLSPSAPEEPLTDFDCLELVPLEFLGLSLAGHTVCLVGGDTGGDRLVKRLVTPFMLENLSVTEADGETGGLATLCPLILFVP